jgi:hypothetical protein
MKKRNRVIKEVLDWIQCAVLIVVLIGVVIGMFCASKWLMLPYIQPCQEYTKVEYVKGDIPVRCDGFWKEMK